MCFATPLLPIYWRRAMTKKAGAFLASLSSWLGGPGNRKSLRQTFLRFTHECSIDQFQSLAKMGSMRCVPFHLAGSLLSVGCGRYSTHIFHYLYRGSRSHCRHTKIHSRRVLDARHIVGTRCDPRRSSLSHSIWHHLAPVPHSCLSLCSLGCNWLDRYPICSINF